MSLVRSKAYVVVAFALLLGACTKTETVVAPVPVPTPTTGTITLQNNSQFTVQFVYISQCASGTWGSDRMPNGQVLAATRSLAFSLAPGCWDVKTVNVNGTAYQGMNNNLNAGSNITLYVTN